jgi:hypothetical protein
VQQQRDEPVYAHTLSITVPVHDNIAAVQIDRQYDTGNQPATIWYAADGRELKQLGNFGTLNRVVPEPLPGPETPQSRAAEKNPSTPNPVWVTPAVGTAHSAFRVHFRVLLNEAEYVTRLSGPRCRGQHLLGTTPGTGSEANDLRSHIYSSAIAVNENEKTWCLADQRHAQVIGARGGSPMPPRAFTARFYEQWIRLPRAQRLAFRRSRTLFFNHLVEAGFHPPFRAGLRIHRFGGTSGWSLSFGDGYRAVFQVGVEVVPGEIHIIWEPIGTHAECDRAY